ncbi:MAG TPA: HlyD family secretion protein [Candidatus Eisenbacteria bacterium]|nr:HlyD family secretion protein [Candidatus Eisenbacteria bacterium]
MSTQIDHELEMEVETNPERPRPLPVREVPRERGEAPALPPPAPARRGPKPIVWIGLAVVVLAALGLGAWQLVYAQHHVTSDDAQVEGHIVPVLPKVSGYVARVAVEENQSVHKGDVLVVLDDRDYAAKLEQANADLAVAQAAGAGDHGTGQAEAQWASAQAAVKEAQARDWQAQRDLERYRQLAAQDVISAQQLESYVAAARVADAHVHAMQSDAEAAGAGVQSARAKSASALAARDQAALQLSYTKITAPSDGVVSKKDVEVGQLVQAGQPLFSIVPLSDVWVTANLKETQLSHVNAGDRVAVTVDTYPGRKFYGRVESLSPATGATFSLLPPDNATGNFTKVVQRVPVRIRLEGGEDPLHPLRPGMSVKVDITT